MKTKDDLIKMQSVPLEVKILMTQRRIREWVSEYGLGMKHVIDTLNSLYGEDFIKY